MDNATKAIMIGVGLFITVIIISAVLVVVNLGTGAMNNASNSMGSVLENLKSPLDLKGTKLSAAQAKALVEKAQNGEFNYAVTVYVDDSNYAIGSPSGQGYKVNNTAAIRLSDLGLNPVYVRISAGSFYGMEKSDDTSAGKPYTATDYTCYVIQSASNSQIGILLK